MTETARKADASTPSAAYVRMEARRQIIRDLLGDTEALHQAGERRLPREVGELPQSGPYGGLVDPYQVRLMSSVVWPFFSDAIEKLWGKVFAEDIKLAEDVPPVIVERLEDIDLQGHNLTQFLSPLFRNMWAEGMPVVLVDSARRSPGPGPVPLAVDDHPEDTFWIYYPSAALIAADYHFEGGKLVWDQIQLKETVREKRDQWTRDEGERIRVLYRGNQLSEGDDRFARFEFHRPTKKGQWVLSTEPGEEPGLMKPHTSIPAVIFRFGKETDCEGRRLPPDEVYPELAHLAWLCNQHVSKKSDQDAMVKRVKLALLHLAGMSKKEFEEYAPKFIGGFTLFLSPKVDGKMDVVESSGTGAEIGRNDLKDLEGCIRLASLRPEIPDKAYQTLGEKIIDTSDGESRLKASAGVLKDGGEELLMITARQLGQTTGGSLLVPTSYSMTQGTAEQLDAIFRARETVPPMLSMEAALGALKEMVPALKDLNVKAMIEAVSREVDQNKLKSLQALAVARN